MTLDERIERTAQMLRDEAIARGYRLSGDGRVCEPDASELLGFSRETLRKLREYGRAPRGYRVGARWTYRITDLAAYIENPENREIEA